MTRTRGRFVACAVVLLSLVAGVLATDAGARTQSSCTQRTLILGAMPLEVNPLIAQVTAQTGKKLSTARAASLTSAAQSLAAIFGCWASGAIAVPLAVPLRLTSIDSLAEEISSRAEKAGISLLATDPNVAALVPLDGLAPRVVGLDELRARGTHAPFADPDPDAPALIQFTSDRHKMGPFVNPGWVKALAWTVAVIIAALNVYLLYQTFAGL